MACGHPRRPRPRSDNWKSPHQTNPAGNRSSIGTHAPGSAAQADIDNIGPIGARHWWRGARSRLAPGGLAPPHDDLACLGRAGQGGSARRAVLRKRTLLVTSGQSIKLPDIATCRMHNTQTRRQVRRARFVGKLTPRLLDLQGEEPSVISPERSDLNEGRSQRPLRGRRLMAATGTALGEAVGSAAGLDDQLRGRGARRGMVRMLLGNRKAVASACLLRRHLRVRHHPRHRRPLDPRRRRTSVLAFPRR